jgi:heat shock protein HslJ
MKYFTLALATCCLLVLSACTSSGSSQALTESIWVLTELNASPPLPDTTITAQFFEDGKVGGSAGCNNYNTTYTVNGKNIQFGELAATTMMACPDPIMQQERDYLDMLKNAATFEIADDELTLLDSDGNALAVFAAQSQDLAGSSWDVISYNNGKEAVVSLIIGSEITANFGEDGQLTGNASCNNYFASYETDGDMISIGPAGATEMFCSEPEGVMEQEQQYLAALETADTYKIEGLKMEMRTDDGALVASFQRKLAP